MVNPDWSFPWIAFEAVDVIEEPDSIVTIPLSFAFICTVCCAPNDKVAESVIVKDVPSALNFFCTTVLDETVLAALVVPVMSYA
jgi:hypothetical protein